jgi:hypothetical protein
LINGPKYSRKKTAEFVDIRKARRKVVD